MHKKSNIKYIGGGCGFQQYCTQWLWDGQKEYLKARQKYINSLYKQYPHNSVRKDYMIYDLLDPLIIPLVELLRSKGVDTITSCHGRDTTSPYVFFYADDRILKRLHKLFIVYFRTINEGWFWNNYIFNYVGHRGGRATYILQFYDILTALRFVNIIKNDAELPISDLFIYKDNQP